MVWDPATDDGGTAVDGFLKEATSLLLEHMKASGRESFLDANFTEAPDAQAEARNPREIDTDRLFTELHQCRGNIHKAIKKVSANPDRYMTVWTPEEKERFDAGHRAYRDSVRMITSSLGGAKSCKDTVDYQYRFKLIESFRRFRRKKREKAEEIMQNVEDRMLHEKVRAELRGREANAGTTDTSSSDEDQNGASSPVALVPRATGLAPVAAPAARVGAVNPRVREWFRTGGAPGANAVGATQQRRDRARDLLLQVQEKVGKDAYAILARSLTACGGTPTTEGALMAVKAAARDVMKEHLDLLERFIQWLPP